MTFGLTRRALLGGTALLCVSPYRAQAARRQVRLGQTNPATSPGGVACSAFTAAAAADPLLQNTLKFLIYNNGALGDEVPCIEGCLDGTIDITMTSDAALSGFVPLLGAIGLPFVFRNVETARAALDGKIGAELSEAASAKGINVLGWAENGLRYMTANKPIRRPADLAGLKVRVPQSEVELAAFRAFGAEPRAIPAQNEYEALRTGEVDAQENVISAIESLRLSEVQKFLCLTGHIYSAFPIIASQDLLDDLSQNERTALMACAKNAVAACRQAASVAEKAVTGRLRAAGMTVVDDVDTTSFVAAAKANMGALSKNYDSGFVARLQQAGA